MTPETLAMLQVSYVPDPFVCVSSRDPAIDKQKSDVVGYHRTRDLKHIVALPGKELTKYYLRLLPITFVKQTGRPWDGKDAEWDAISYFLWCVEKIEGFSLSNGQKVVVEPTTPLQVSAKKTIMTWPEEVLDNGAFSLPLVLEIGMVAYARHFLLPGEELSLPVPAFLTQSSSSTTSPTQQSGSAETLTTGQD